MAERIALPPEAVAVVELRAPGVATVLAETRVALAGRQVPVPFRLKVPVARLSGGTTFEVQGAIAIAGRTTYVTRTFPVTRPAGEEVAPVILGDLRLQRHQTLAFSRSYMCGSRTITVGMQGDVLTLDHAGRLYPLRVIPAAGSLRHEAVEDPDLQFWTEGEDAWLKWPGEPPASCAQMAEAPAGGAEPRILPVADTPSFEGRWQVLSVGETAVEGTRRPVTLVLNAGGRLGGDGPCNTYGASYSTSGPEFRVGHALSTMMACEPPIMTLERRYFDLLSKVTTWQREGDRLTLASPDGERVLARRLD
jgi:heat shock protein HslJ